MLAIQDRIDNLQHTIGERTDYESTAYLQLIQQLTDAHEQFERRGGLTMHASIERVLTGLGFDAAELDKPLTAFSGGWQMRAELAKLLLSKPDVLLLDEPTNHLDIESVQWLEQFLSEYDGVVVLVSHDRTFLDNVTNRTIEITQARIHDLPVSYSDYEEIREERMEQQRSAALKQAREKAHIQSLSTGSGTRQAWPHASKAASSTFRKWKTSKSTIPTSARCALNSRLHLAPVN